MINILICEDCNKEFKSIDEAVKHTEKTKHHSYKLKTTNLCLKIGQVKK